MALNALLQGHEDVDSLLVPEYIQSAPDVVRRRICALKKLQLKTVGIQANFYKRVHELETEFRGRFDDINSQRQQIISGKYEPAENECDVKLFSWMDEEHLSKFNDGVTASGDGNPKGIPDFWLHTLKTVPGVGELINEQDEAVLRYLNDITVDQVNEPPSFTLKFHFDENPYFKESTLTKYYSLSIGPNGLEEEVMYDGPSIIATKGCEIQWKEGKNVTEKTIKKKTKGKHGKAITKVVSTESFFRFFAPEVEKVEKDMDEDTAEQINMDFEAGQMIRDAVIDGAILYYTGESVENDDDFEYGHGEDDENDEEDDEE